jgi:hypothetical protein
MVVVELSMVDLSLSNLEMRRNVVRLQGKISRLARECQDRSTTYLTSRSVGAELDTSSNSRTTEL